MASPGFHPRCNSTGDLVSFTAAKPIFTRPAWLHPREFRTEALAGLVVAIALIPEAISFSILAGVDPRVGLFASFTMAVALTAFEILIQALQAYIFTLLTAVYISGALHAEH